MSYQTERHNIEPMSKEAFLQFFEEECRNANIREVIDQNIFISSMTYLLSHTLKRMGYYNLSEIDRFDHKKYIGILLENLNKLTIDDFKSRSLRKENSKLFKENEKLTKQNEQLKIQSNQYFLAGTKEVALSVVGKAPLTILDFAISKMSEKRMERSKSHFFGQELYSGFSFADIAQKTVVNNYVNLNLKIHDSCSKKVRKFIGVPSRQSINKFGDNMYTILKGMEDVVTLVPLNVLNPLSIGMSGIVIAADAGFSAFYSLKMTMNNMKMAINNSKIAINNAEKSVENISNSFAESLGLKKNFIELLKSHFSALENDKTTLCKMVKFSIGYIKKKNQINNNV